MWPRYKHYWYKLKDVSCVGGGCIFTLRVARVCQTSTVEGGIWLRNCRHWETEQPTTYHKYAGLMTAHPTFAFVLTENIVDLRWLSIVLYDVRFAMRCKCVLLLCVPNSFVVAVNFMWPIAK